MTNLSLQFVINNAFGWLYMDLFTTAWISWNNFVIINTALGSGEKLLPKQSFLKRDFSFGYRFRATTWRLGLTEDNAEAQRLSVK